MTRSRRGLKSGTVQRMLRLAPEAEERASAREERGVRDIGREGRGKKRERRRERYRVAEARHEREDSLGKWGNKILYLSPSLSLSLFLSRSTKKGCQMRYRRL